MPVEIKELVIRATVTASPASSAEPEPGAVRHLRDDGAERRLPDAELERIVSICTSRVLRAVKRARER